MSPPTPAAQLAAVRQLVGKSAVKIQRKIGTAIQILASDGLVALLSVFKKYIGNRPGANRPDESGIAFRALKADRLKGLMIDVGAHLGAALFPFAHSGWRVFAFEPDSKNRNRLRASFGGLQNVVIDSRAVSDHAQEKAILYRSKESNGISGLSAFHPSHHPAEEVNVTTLEYFFDEQGFAHQDIDFLKIDTEGFDLHVLKGIPWHRISPRLILCEFEDSKTIPLGYTFHDLANFLVNHGYRLIVSEWHPIRSYGVPHDWRRFATYPCELEDSRSWGNILATKEERIFESLLQICGVNR